MLSICEQLTTATVSARKVLTASVTLSTPPDTGMPAISVRRRRPPGTHAATISRPCEVSRLSAVTISDTVREGPTTTARRVQSPRRRWRCNRLRSPYRAIMSRAVREGSASTTYPRARSSFAAYEKIATHAVRLTPARRIR